MDKHRSDAGEPTAAVPVIITLDPSCLRDRSRWADAVGRLRRHGVTIAKELDQIGIVTGQAPQQKFAEIERDPLVLKVEADQRRSVR
jgi:hypothetical protein